jgi:DNA-binding MarR family transcriptional regulator
MVADPEMTVAPASDEPCRVGPSEYNRPTMPCTLDHEWREPDPDALDIVYTHHKLHQRIRVTMDQALEGNFVSYAQYRMLTLLDHTPNMFLNQMARELRVSRQASRGVLDRLDWAGLVERVDGYEHEQAKPYHVTDLGRHRLHRMHELARARFAPMHDRLGAGERRTLIELMLAADRSLDPPRRPMWWLE